MYAAETNVACYGGHAVDISVGCRSPPHRRRPTKRKTAWSMLVSNIEDPVTIIDIKFKSQIRDEYQTRTSYSGNRPDQSHNYVLATTQFNGSLSVVPWRGGYLCGVNRGEGVVSAERRHTAGFCGHAAEEWRQPQHNGKKHHHHHNSHTTTPKPKQCAASITAINMKCIQIQSEAIHQVTPSTSTI
jgi:hypothetical protein